MRGGLPLPAYIRLPSKYACIMADIRCFEILNLLVTSFRLMQLDAIASHRACFWSRERDSPLIFLERSLWKLFIICFAFLWVFWVTYMYPLYLRFYFHSVKKSALFFGPLFRASLGSLWDPSPRRSHHNIYLCIEFIYYASVIFSFCKSICCMQHGWICYHW